VRIVSTQLGWSENHALALIRERAGAIDLPVEEIALAVVEGHIRFRPG
jgi:hypothetical protein